MAETARRERTAARRTDADGDADVEARAEPAARVARCKRFLERLGGVRGWYARVVRAGDVAVGDAVRLGLG